VERGRRRLRKVVEAVALVESTKLALETRRAGSASHPVAIDPGERKSLGEEYGSLRHSETRDEIDVLRDAVDAAEVEVKAPDLGARRQNVTVPGPAGKTGDVNAIRLDGDLERAHALGARLVSPRVGKELVLPRCQVDERMLTRE
jgi:hypothetical protein